MFGNVCYLTNTSFMSNSKWIKNHSHRNYIRFGEKIEKQISSQSNKEVLKRNEYSFNAGIAERSLLSLLCAKDSGLN